MNQIEKAFSKVSRADFLPDYAKEEAYLDAPLSIGFGQTNSQPSTVRMMLEWLEVKPGSIILDVGSGSGWTGALLAFINGPKGKVYAVEKIPELVEFGRSNCQAAGIENVEFFRAGRKFGLPKYAPYDRILVSASAKKLPEELLNQLKIDGKLVIPVGYDILEITKVSQDDYVTQKHPGFMFVPLV